MQAISINTVAASANSKAKPRNINERVRRHVEEASRDNTQCNISIDDNSVSHVESDGNVNENGSGSDCNNDFNIFSDHDSGDEDKDELDEYIYEMPRVFEDDDKFDDEVSTSIANVVQSLCKKKADIANVAKDNKIPVNCKGLVSPPVNIEIWQFLDRRAKTEDLTSQNVQKHIASGIAAVIKVAHQLRNKNFDLDKTRKALSDAITLLCSAHFEMSIKRRMSLRPHIEKKYVQLCNRNEPVGEKFLFGDDISKRLNDINTVFKINRNISSKTSYIGRGKSSFLGRRQNQSLRGRGSGFRRNQSRTLSLNQKKSWVKPNWKSY